MVIISNCTNKHTLNLLHMSKIHENLYIGTYEDAIKEGNQFDIIISALSTSEYHMFDLEVPHHVEWHKLQIMDTEEEEISLYFHLTDEILRQAKRQGKKVLVHCAAGKSRSPTLVIAHLMLENEWTRKATYEYVSRKRIIIEPNEGFLNQLKSLEVWMDIKKKEKTNTSSE